MNPMKLQSTTKPQANGFSLVEVMVAASVSSILMSASFAGLAGMAKLQAKAQLRGDATENLSLAKLDYADSLALNTTSHEDCTVEILQEDAVRGWAELKSTCTRGSLNAEVTGYAIKEAAQAV